MTEVERIESLDFNGKAFVFDKTIAQFKVGDKSVTFGNNLKIIGDYVFSGCTSLTDVSIPESVEDIGINAFDFRVNNGGDFNG